MLAGVEGQQQQLEMRLAAVLARGGDAGDRTQRLVGDNSRDLRDLAAAGLREQRGKTPVLEVTPCERANARAGDAEGEAEVGLARQHEDVAEQLADRGRVDV